MRKAASILALVLVSANARADSVNPQPSRDSVWYGWQILIPDVLILTPVAAASVSDARSVALWIGSVAFLMPGSLVHPVHHNGVYAYGSVAIRATLITLGALIGLGIGGTSTSVPCDGGRCIELLANESAAFYWGALLGAGAASALDVSLLAWEPRGRAPNTATWTLTPRVDRGGGGLSVVGSF